jgi:hypothetical protein
MALVHGSFTNGLGNFFPASGLPFAEHRIRQYRVCMAVIAVHGKQTYIYNRLATENYCLKVTTTAVIFNNHILRSKFAISSIRRCRFGAIFDCNSVLPNERLVALQRKKRFTTDFLMTCLLNPGTALHGYTDGYQNRRIDPMGMRHRLLEPALRRVQ